MKQQEAYDQLTEIVSNKEEKANEGDRRPNSLISTPAVI
jgi:hypothetical protein